LGENKADNKETIIFDNEINRREILIVNFKFMNTKQEYLRQVWDLIEGWLKELPHTKEDEEKINKLWRFYGRKKNIKSGQPKSTAVAMLWAYARINFLWEQESNLWMQKSLAKICGVGTETIGRKTSELMKSMKIEMMDQRFARQEMADKNPMNKLLVDPKTGMLFFANNDLDDLSGVPVVKSKDDYYYDAMECLNERDFDYAVKLLRKAIDLDEHCVQSYVGMTSAYMYKGNQKKFSEYANKAFEETKRVFPKWPEKMIWGEMENRQFLRAIFYKADLYSQEGEKEEAIILYKLILKLNPNDNQGVRYFLAGLYAGLSGDDVGEYFDRGNEKQNWDDLENLLNDQNRIHKFWQTPEME
jgi:tetratricopeptide (TPR) repeat protein